MIRGWALDGRDVDTVVTHQREERGMAVRQILSTRRLAQSQRGETPEYAPGTTFVQCK